MPSVARAPGKLYIAGEYAVVTPGHGAVLVATSQQVTVSATSAPGGAITIDSELYPPPRTWLVGQSRTDYVTSALATIEEFRADAHLPEQCYRLQITSNLERGGRKLGLGSSGAVTVATIAAVAGLYGLHLTLEQTFRLALCATIHISPRASGGDLATSTWGGYVHYTSPNREHIAAALRSDSVSAVMANEDLWHGCEVRSLPSPPLRLLVGWTGAPADTNSLVGGTSVNDEFRRRSAHVVNQVVEAFTHARPADLLQATTQARHLLSGLSSQVETPTLARLADIAESCGGAGKTSGAGGGDCGIAFASPSATPQILKQWEDSGIIPLDVTKHEGETG